MFNQKQNLPIYLTYGILAYTFLVSFTRVWSLPMVKASVQPAELLFIPLGLLAVVHPAHWASQKQLPGWHPIQYRKGGFAMGFHSVGRKHLFGAETSQLGNRFAASAAGCWARLFQWSTGGTKRKGALPGAFAQLRPPFYLGWCLG